MSLITSLLAITLSAGTSLLYATIGEIYTERSGILNLGVEGIMMMSAVSAFAVSYYSGSLILSILIAMLVGGLLSLLHAFLSISTQSNQVVSGLSITIFGTGMASFLGQRLGPESNGFYLIGLNGARFYPVSIPVLENIPILSALIRQDLMTWGLYLIVPLAWFYLYKTRPGLNLRAVGENPRTAEAMGIPVIRTRYLYTILGGMFVGIGGAHLSLAYTPGWAEFITGGRGWIVIALVIFAVWNPGRAVFGALLFGGINAVQFRLQAAGTHIPASFLNMLPYIMTITVLAAMTRLGRKRVHSFSPPASLGTTFIKEDK